MEIATFEEMCRVQESYHEEAMKIPGVHGTGGGLKSVSGEATDILAVRIHLTKKRSLDEVPEAERIPARIAGSTMEGGARLLVAGFYGTGGCMVRDLETKAACLLSNRHVLLAKGTDVYVEKRTATTMSARH